MSATNNDMIHEAIPTRRAHGAAGAADAGAIAEATLGTWREVAARLAPVIGFRGVDVLFRRALHLTSLVFPWFAVAGDHEDSAALLASLKARLEERDPDAAAKASHALLATFNELLRSLIGASLAERLLGPVGPLPLPAPPSEKATES